jgi:hypothetical protein
MRIKKQARVSLFAAILLACPSGVALANFSGGDDFNDNSKDGAKWGNDVFGTTGTALLTETNGRLQLTASGTDPFAYRPWIANTGSYTANWSVQMDVNVPTLTLTSGQAYGVSIVVSNHDDPNDRFEVDLELNALGAPTPPRAFFTVFTTNGMDVLPDGASSTTSTSAAVRIRYDAGTKTLFGDFDADGATNGYSFTNFDSRSVAPWGMTAASVFDAGVSGFSQGGAVVTAGDAVFGDNFLAVPEPSSAFLCLSGVVLCLKRRPLRPRNRRA